MDELIDRVGKIWRKQKKSGDWLEDRVFQFYHTNLPYATFVDCNYWHKQGKRIGEA